MISSLLGSSFYISKLQKSSFMFTPYCKLYPLSSTSTKNVLHVCKPLHFTYFGPNSISVYG
ncbi:hypothetical protein Hanom_Chr01g00023631 [Helianthus anomalus]